MAEVVAAMVSNVAAVPPLDLRQVWYFVTVARELNFTRAAERLHISAPALSQQIKALERQLGVQLLVRDTRSVHLTPAGEVFAQAGHRLLDDGEAAVLESREVAGLMTGQLVIAAIHEAESAFEPFLADFHVTYPGVQFKIAALRHAELLNALREGSADVALTWSFLLDRASDSEGLHWVEVAPTEVMAALHPSSPLAGDDRVRRGEPLRGTPVVLFEREYSPVTYDYAVEELYGHGCPDPPVQEISVTVRAQEAMARCVASTGALAPLSRPVAEMLRGEWVTRSFDPPWMTVGCVVWRGDSTSPALTAFRAAAVEASRGIGRSDTVT